MVRKAQAVRERILRDLARRRRTALQQVEQLRAGRERLLETYAVVRSIMDDAEAELAVAEVEARAAAEAAVVQLDEPEPTIEELEAEVVALRDEPPTEGPEEPEEADVAAAAPPEPVAEPEPAEPAAAEPGPAAEAEREPAVPVIDLRDRPAPAPEPVVTVAERRTSALRILRPAEPESAGAAVPAAEGDPAGSRPEVDDVFARLRADRAASAGPEDDEDDQAEDEGEVDGAAAAEGPEDVAGVAAMLLGPEGRFVTGQVIRVDGGRSAVAG
jgi:hypothetical protein